MYLDAQTRRLGDPITAALSAAGIATDPVSVSVSPLMLGGLGLLALAVVISLTKKTATAVTRKGRAVSRALRPETVMLYFRGRPILFFNMARIRIATTRKSTTWRGVNLSRFWMMFARFMWITRAAR